MYSFTGRKKTYSIGRVITKLSNGQCVVAAGGRKVVISPITDEPINVGSRVRLAATGTLIQQAVILGADK